MDLRSIIWMISEPTEGPDTLVLIDPSQGAFYAATLPEIEPHYSRYSVPYGECYDAQGSLGSVGYRFPDPLRHSHKHGVTCADANKSKFRLSYRSQ